MIAQGRYEVRAGENLATHEHNRAVDGRNAFVAESDVAKHNALLVANTERVMRTQRVDLQNRVDVRERSETALQVQRTDMNLESRQEARAATSWVTGSGRMWVPLKA